MIDVKVMYNANVIEDYHLDDSEFLYNGNKIVLDNNRICVMNLLSYISQWEDVEVDDVVQGFYIRTNMNGNIKEYAFFEKLPVNFNSFMFELRKMIKEEK